MRYVRSRLSMRLPNQAITAKMLSISSKYYNRIRDTIDTLLYLIWKCVHAIGRNHIT